MPMRGEGRLGRHPWHHTVPPPRAWLSTWTVLLLSTPSLSHRWWWRRLRLSPPLTTCCLVTLASRLMFPSSARLGAASWAEWEKRVFFFHLFIIWVCHSSKRSFFFFLSWCLSYSQVPVTLVKISRCLGSLARVIFGTASRSYGRLHQGGESLAILTIQFWFGFFGVQNDLEAISTFSIETDRCVNEFLSNSSVFLLPLIVCSAINWAPRSEQRLCDVSWHLFLCPPPGFMLLRQQQIECLCYLF